MLLRIAQGDAHGAACEYLDLPGESAVRDPALAFERYGRHPRHGLEAGRDTDDTQMSIAIAEVLPVRRPLTRGSFAAAFVHCFRRDPRRGYSRGFQGLLEQVASGGELLARVRGGSDKNGAAMRAGPLGVLNSLSLVREVATVQAKVTHDTMGGVDAAVAEALMSHFVLWTDEPLTRLRPWLQAQMLGADISDEPWVGPVEGPRVGWKSALAVLALVGDERSLLDVASTALSWGGDTDSVLAIAWGIASTRMSEPLPDFFDEGLEQGLYGRDFLLRLGAELMELAASPRQ